MYALDEVFGPSQKVFQFRMQLGYLNRKMLYFTEQSCGVDNFTNATLQGLEKVMLVGDIVDKISHLFNWLMFNNQFFNTIDIMLKSNK